MARKETIEANLYQKRFNYNHLYNIPSDELERIIEEKQTKTARSFTAVKEAFRPVMKKEVDLIVTGSPCLIDFTDGNPRVYQIPDDHRRRDDYREQAHGALAGGRKRRRGERIVKTSVPARGFSGKKVVGLISNTK
ncbi:MAG: hypothetical protein ACOX5N_07105 [Bacilli bacterium]